MINKSTRLCSGHNKWAHDKLMFVLIQTLAMVWTFISAPDSIYILLGG